MREILFRAKRKYADEWVEGFLTIDPTICDYVIDIVGIASTPISYETVGQYTGLTDKNGKKIFEGDILGVNTVNGYVLFDNGCFAFIWKNNDKHRPDFFKTCILVKYARFNEVEVIGNIHDNPELLKGGAE